MSSQTSNEAATGDSIKTGYKQQLDKAAEKVKGPPAGTNDEPKETLLDKGLLLLPILPGPPFWPNIEEEDWSLQSKANPNAIATNTQ